MLENKNTIEITVDDNKEKWDEVFNIIEILIKNNYAIKLWRCERDVVIEYNFDTYELSEYGLEWITEDEMCDIFYRRSHKDGEDEY